MFTVWIVHRDDRARAALVRLVGSSDAVIGRPSDPIFEAAPAADVVVLGLAGDWEAELEFAHRQRSRLAQAHWVLIGNKDEADAAYSQFDQLAADFLAYPPRADDLARAARPALAHRPPLSERARRESAAARFSRWLADLELPELLRALDPRLAEVPVLVRGEPGTGRGTLVRYLHHFGGTAGGALAHIPCAADTSVREIETALIALGRVHPRVSSQSVWLDEVGALAPRAQRELATWLEGGRPRGVRTPTLRWMASTDTTGPALEAPLARALGTIEIRLPPLRERSERIERIAEDVAAAWARARRESPRRFDADARAFLCEYPWPGNLRELEAVVEQTLASTARDPISIDDLVLEGSALAPLDASAVGTLLPDGERESAEPEHRAQPSAPGESVAPAARRAPAADLPMHRAEPPRIREDDPGLRRLANALIHQVRNPLATIRTFTELLPERFDDPDFRARFPEMVREDVGRIHGLLARLEELASLDAPRREKVDVAELISDLLEQRREAFRERHHLVLKELDSSRPTALADSAQLRLAFEALFDKALAIVPERGDLYIASRRHEGSGSNGATVRVLLRFHDPSAGGENALGPLQNSIELLIAELIVRAQGGRLTLGASEAEERVLVVDLPAP
jgi:DNA-binding NtrC family response regulator